MPDPVTPPPWSMAAVPTLNAARHESLAMTQNHQQRPYTSWVDLTQHLRNESSVINFIAVYGRDSALTAADVDAALMLGGRDDQRRTG